MNKYVFGVDLGGTTVKMGLFAEDATLIDKWEIPTDKAEKGSKILPDIAASIQEKINEKSKYEALKYPIFLLIKTGISKCLITSAPDVKALFIIILFITSSLIILF